jgi:hypothetical protein
MRHIQATAGASSARWIGALSIASFRAFVEDAFANDRYPFNGEGVHALTHNKHLVDMSGVTHLAQAVPYDAPAQDAVTQSGYPLVQETPLGPQKIRLYANPAAFPKAFLVESAVFEADDTVTRHRLTNAAYQPRQLIYVNGPTPPGNLAAPVSGISRGNAAIIKYEPTEVEVKVSTPTETWLVLTDSWTPQWETFIDGQWQNPYIANTVWRTARVPAGEHTVSFRYHSPATDLAKKLSLTALAVIVLLLLTPSLIGRLRYSKNLPPAHG